MTPNSQLIQKTDMTIASISSDGGLLLDEQAEEFVKVAIKGTTFTAQCTTKTTAKPGFRLPNLRFGSRVLKPGVAAAALAAADRMAPTMTNTTITPSYFKAQVNLEDLVSEDNVEGEDFAATIFEALGAALRRDIEDVGLNGITTSNDATLAVMNGWRALLSTNIGVAGGGAALSKALLKSLFKTVPAEFRDDPGLKFFTSPKAVIDYQDVVADRATTYGDEGWKEGRGSHGSKVWAFGHEVVSVPMYPENLTGGSDTEVMACNPKNAHLIFRRNIRIKRQEDAETGLEKLVATVRFGVGWEYEPAVALMDNILTS